MQKQLSYLDKLEKRVIGSLSAINRKELTVGEVNLNFLLSKIKEVDIVLYEQLNLRYVETVKNLKSN